ncbi:MAG TPA: DUF3467 domain-containing protein [Bryobacteraceae bacterium]|jgi:hypothetical protein|nr:DUF3467 domain-containing protein [Bryobacteraceae bacterium]
MDEAQAGGHSAENNEVNADYANNTMFEPTVWDLKLIFGEYSARSQSIEVHTSITVPWAQAKLMLYYLQANVAAHEVVHGKIKIPEAVVPPEWPPLTPEQAKIQRRKRLSRRSKRCVSSFLIV